MNTMNTFLLWSHPIIQIIAVVTGLVAMWQGWKRWQFTHGKKVMFPWKKHVKLGSVALVLWTLGATGFYVTHKVFGINHITGLHAWLAWVIIALSIFGLVSGYIMNKYKKRRKVLNVIHGLVNVALLILILVETGSGIRLIWMGFI